MKCICRFCKKEYNNQTSRCDYTGYCTQRCMKAKARELGWTPAIEKMYKVSIYDKLKRHGQVGDVKA